MKNFYAILIVLVGILFGAGPLDVSALTVSPAKLEIAGDPGTTLAGTIELFNEQNKTQTLYTSYENFESNDDTGAPRFVGGDSGLATWIDVQDSLTLLPQERIEVPYTITIPENADAGGYFAALFFGNQPPQEEGGTVSIGGRLGVLILLRVNGDIPEAGGILDFESTDQKRFYTTPPIEFVYRFSNTGGDRVAPEGTIEMHNTFGITTESFDANPKQGSVLPGTARKFTNTWEATVEPGQGFFGNAKSQWNDFHFGWYTAHLDLMWGASDQTVNETYSFFILPWQLVLLALIVIMFVICVLKFIGRQYRASLIRQFELQQAQKEKTSKPKAKAKKKTKKEAE